MQIKSSTGQYACLALLVWAAPAAAQQFPAPRDGLIDAAMIAQAREMASAPVAWKSVIAQNERNADFRQADITRLDEQWVAERESDDQPLIAGVLTGPLSGYLTRVQAGSLGLYTEVFVTDMHGLNVGQSAVTSDFWQGDEAKFQKTYPVGADAVFIDAAEFNDESGTWRQQLNMTVTDPDGGQPIGSITVEINLTELERRRRHQAGM